MRENRFSPNFQQRLDQSEIARSILFSRERFSPRPNPLAEAPVTYTRQVKRAPKALNFIAALGVSFSMLTACIGPFAPQPQPEHEAPAVVQQEPTLPEVPTLEPIKVQVTDEVDAFTFDGPDPYGSTINNGAVSFTDGFVHAKMADFYRAKAEKAGPFIPTEHRGEYDEAYANDADAGNKYQRVRDWFTSRVDQRAYINGNSMELNTRFAPDQAPNQFPVPKNNDWSKVIDPKGEYVAPATPTPSPSSTPDTRSDATPIPSVPLKERLPGGLRPWYIKSATDGDPKILGNYTKSLETNLALKEFNQREGRKSIEEIGVTTFTNSAKFIFERVPGVSLQVLEQAFKLGEYRIAYKNTAGKIEFTKVVVVKGQTNESLHQISTDEEVLAFKIIYQDGREAIRLLRIMCIQEFDVEVPVPKVDSTAIPAGALPARPSGQLGIPVGAPPIATLRPPRILPTETPRAVTEYRLPATPVTFEQLPRPIREFVQNLPSGQQVVIKLFDANNNGFCDDPLTPEVSGVFFEISYDVPIDGRPGVVRKTVYTNQYGVATGDAAPQGQAFRVIEFVKPGQRPLWAFPLNPLGQPEGRAGQLPVVFCDGPNLTVTPTATSASTFTPSPIPTTIFRGFTPGPTETGIPIPTVTATPRPGETPRPTDTPPPTVTLGPSPTPSETPTSTPTPRPGETPRPTDTGTATATAFIPTATFTPVPTGIPTAERTATSLPVFTATASPSPFFSLTPTQTPEPVRTSTSTATSAPTFTSTEAPTATRTATSTATPTSTVRSTATPQSFPTSSPTVRSTATPAR